TRNFDEKACDTCAVITSTATFSSTLTVDAGLGDVSGNTATYDDVDDFNGYTKTVPTTRLGNYFDSVKVYYVAEDYPDVVSYTQTYLKRIYIRVRNKYLAPLSTDSTVK